MDALLLYFIFIVLKTEVMFKVNGQSQGSRSSQMVGQIATLLFSGTFHEVKCP